MKSLSLSLIYDIILDYSDLQNHILIITLVMFLVIDMGAIFTFLHEYDFVYK